MTKRGSSRRNTDEKTPERLRKPPTRKKRGLDERGLRESHLAKLADLMGVSNSFQPPWPSHDIQFRTTDDLVELWGTEARRAKMAVDFRDLMKEFPDEDLRFAFLCGFEVGIRGGTVIGLGAVRSLYEHQWNRLFALERRNRPVFDEERRAAEDLDRELASEFPKRTVRYREIARRMEDLLEEPVKADRVRLILEGPRKSRREDTGKKKRTTKD